MSRYENSESWLIRAEKTIPLGSQTFSKSKTQYPFGISPFYISHAKGSYVWDLDRNKYIDLINSLASVTLGYCDRGMKSAIKRQLNSGISYSLPGKLEAEVSEKLVELIPSAEMVRFGKNGSDATSAAVRLARAYTSRDKLLVCGYHGWQDWYIGSTSRNKGVPKSVSDLTISFPYNDLEEFMKILNTHRGKVAAVVMEPMNFRFPKIGYLERIREITQKEGIVLIFDETITGFRFAKGGAQELFGVTPDLSTFGKGMANGMPLSAVVGKRELMMEMENIFFSGTFGGELLSLASANYVVDKYLEENVTEELSKIGREISENALTTIKDVGLNKTVELSGHDSWKFINWKETNGIGEEFIKTYFMQEIFKSGILLLNTFNVSFAMNRKIIRSTNNILNKVLEKVAKKLENGSLLGDLRAAPIQPLFKVR